MKKFFVSLVMLLSTSVVSLFAQSSQIATLNHEGEFSVYYGTSALASAYNKAVAGDVITLSEGVFDAVNLTKHITLRGVGMGVSVNDANISIESSTVLSGDFYIRADGSSSSKLVVEGIVNGGKVTLEGINHVQLIKCTFYDICFRANYGGLAGLTFTNCYVSNSFSSLYNIYLTANNSVFKNASFSGPSCSFVMNNCIIEIDSYTDLDNAKLNNCIIVNNNTSIASSYTKQQYIYNSLWVGNVPENGNPFSAIGLDQNNSVLPNDINVFEDGTFFKLTDEAKEYLDSDSTEVGIYSGIPFTPITSNLRIIKCNVASKSTADGKLSVDIEVASME